MSQSRKLSALVEDWLNGLTMKDAQSEIRRKESKDFFYPEMIETSKKTTPLTPPPSYKSRESEKGARSVSCTISTRATKGSSDKEAKTSMIGSRHRNELMSNRANGIPSINTQGSMYYSAFLKSRTNSVIRNSGHKSAAINDTRSTTIFSKQRSTFSVDNIPGSPNLHHCMRELCHGTKAGQDVHVVDNEVAHRSQDSRRPKPQVRAVDGQEVNVIEGDRPHSLQHDQDNSPVRAGMQHEHVHHHFHYAVDDSNRSSRRKGPAFLSRDPAGNLQVERCMHARNHQTRRKGPVVKTLAKNTVGNYY